MPQLRNDQMIAMLSADFQRRYEPQFAWENAVALHLMLPGLRGFWPMGSVNEFAHAIDMSGQGRNLAPPAEISLTYNNWYFAPYVNLDGVNDWLWRGDEAALDILGTENYIGNPGITLGAWVRPRNAVLNDEYIISKQTAPANPNCSYALYRTAAGNLRLRVGQNASTETQDSATTMSSNTWYHCVGRWIPTLDRSVFLDGVESSAGASAIAALQNTAANLFVGGYDPGTRLFPGYISLAFLCCYALPDTIIQSIWQQTRAMFNK